MKKKYITIGMIAGAAILFMAFAVWIGMMLGARSRDDRTESRTESPAPGIAESSAPDSDLPESAPLDSESIPARSKPESTPKPTPEPERLADHVTGIRDFAVIEGMRPDVMAGVTIHATVRHDLEQFLYGMEGAVYVPVGGEFDPMENVVCDDEIAKIEPDMSALDTTKEGEYLISYHLTGTDGVSQTAVRRVHVGEEPVSPVPGQQVQTDVGEYSTVTDLGLWRLTAYMDTPEDQGPYVGQTASGAPLVAGRTVAVSQQTCERLGLVFGDRLMVDGYVYILEDYGGSAMYNSDWLDIFVDNVEDEYSERFNRYAEVYLLR